MILIITIAPVLLFIKPKPINTRVAVLRWNRTGITVAGNATSLGTGADQLRYPWDLALDWQENLYVTDRHNHRVQKFARGSKIGVTIAGNSNGVSGSDASSFSQCTGIVVDEHENIYVSDYNHRVMFWSRGSTSGVIVAGNGTAMKENNTLNTPHGLQYDSSTGTLYIADAYNHRIMHYLPGATSGTQIAGGSTAGLSYTQLYHIWGFHLDTITNSLIIGNAYGRNVVRWRFGDSNWTSMAGILGVRSMTSTTFDEPCDVTLDPMGNMYVVDIYANRIQFFWVGESNGTTILGVTGQNGPSANLLYKPGSLILDNQLNIYVVDCYNHRVQKFLRY